MAKTKKDKKLGDVEIVDHVVSKEDLEINPELSDVIKEGDTIQIPVVDDTQNIKETEDDKVIEKEDLKEPDASSDIKSKDNVKSKVKNNVKTFRGKKIIAINKIIINGIERTELNLNDERIIVDDEELSKIK